MTRPIQPIIMKTMEITEITGMMITGLTPQITGATFGTIILLMASHSGWDMTHTTITACSVGIIIGILVTITDGMLDIISRDTMEITIVIIILTGIIIIQAGSISTELTLFQDPAVTMGKEEPDVGMEPAGTDRDHPVRM
jgi:hypothetical protein